MGHHFLIIKDPTKPSYRLNLAAEMKRYLSATGHRVMETDYKAADLNALATQIQREQIQIMVTISFYPKISQMARRLEVDYFCWEFDKFANPALLDPKYYSAHTFFFATCRVDAQLVKRHGIQGCLLPTCRDILLSPDYVLTDEEQAAYRCDISFIGEPLLEKNNPWPAFAERMREGPDETRTAREGILSVAQGALADQEGYTLKSEYRLPTMIHRRLKKSRVRTLVDVPTLTSALEKEACRFQRDAFLRLKNHQIDVYGPDEWRRVAGKHVRYRHFAGYDYEAGKIYKASRINLNLTRIYGGFTGYSNRVFNIVSSGGFLATTPTKNQELFFEPGKECAVFSTPEELQELCDHYLNNETERVAVAKAGRQRFERDHQMGRRVEAMLAFREQTKGRVDC